MRKIKSRSTENVCIA